MGKHRSAGGRAPSGRGKHRKPTTAGRNAARVAVAGVVLSAPTMMGAGVANAQGGFDHDAIIACESGGDARAQNSSSSASGLYQFIDSTWRAYGGSTSSAKDASVSEQRRVAERLFAAEGYSPWNASKSCWSGKIGSGSSVSISNGEAPRKADKPQRAAKSEAASEKSAAKAAPKKVTKQRAAKPKVAAKAGNGKHTVVSGDTLSGLALRYTGDSWQSLHERNRDVIGANPHHIVPGQVLEVRK